MRMLVIQPVVTSHGNHAAVLTRVHRTSARAAASKVYRPSPSKETGWPSHSDQRLPSTLSQSDPGAQPESLLLSPVVAHTR